MLKWIQNGLLFAVLGYVWFLIFSDVQQITYDDPPVSSPTTVKEPKSLISIFSDSLLAINPFILPHSQPVVKTSILKSVPIVNSDTLDLQFIGELVFPDNKTRIYSFVDSNGQEYSVRPGEVIYDGWVFSGVEGKKYLFRKNGVKVLVGE